MGVYCFDLNICLQSYSDTFHTPVPSFLALDPPGHYLSTTLGGEGRRKGWGSAMQAPDTTKL